MKKLIGCAVIALVAIAAAPAHASLYITEFVALNSNGLTDDDGDFSDWLEIYNDGASAVDVGGWYLTDDSALLTKWQFPPTSIGAGAYLVVFASDKNRAVAGAELHTNFKLSGGGEYLGLVRDDGVTIEHEYAPGFPAQTDDVAWGLTNDLGQQRCFSNPTPGALNQESPSCGIVESLGFSPARGFFDTPVDVTITSATGGAQIYYTLDGSEPSATNGTLYTAPVHVATTTAIRAVAIAPPLLPTASVTHTYIFLNDVIHQTGAGFPTEGFNADYAMDPDVVNDPRYAGEIIDDFRTVPTISIVTNVDDMFGPQNGIYSHAENRGIDSERRASAELIRTDGSTGFQINCGIRISGRLSRAKDPKHSFRLSFKSIYGPPKLEYPLFPDTPVKRFNKLRLRASHNKSWSFGGQRADYIRDQWVRDTQIDMGEVASHGVFMHVYVNGLYWGLFNVVEQPEAEFAVSYFGGAEEEWDVLEPAQTQDGTRDAWRTAQDIARAGVETPAGYAALRDYVDFVNLADYMITNIHAGTRDWDASNWYAARRRLPGEGFRFFSWDAEQSMEKVRAVRTGVANPGNPSAFYKALQANPEFRVLMGDRLHRHFFNGGVLTAVEASRRYMERAEEIYRALVPESARWGDARQPNNPLDRDSDWIPEVEWLRLAYFPQRSAIVLDQFRAEGLYPAVVAPTFSQHGGLLPPSATVEISAPAGTIYYTLDGSDPRLEGGAVSPSANVYGAPIALGAPTTVRSRALVGSEWSALDEALFTPDVGLRVSEVMYHPADPTLPSPYEDSDFEFIELVNIGGSSVDLTGMRLTQGITFTFGAQMLAPGAHVLAVRNPVAFESRYGAGLPVAGQYSGKLANEGERVRLENASGDEILDFTYSDGWYPETDGPGRSLVAADLQADRAAWSRADGWRPSTFAGGSPGAAELPRCSDGVDNDGDSLADANDPGCASPAQDDEAPACNNGIDDDGDGAVDTADPHCDSAADTDEAAPPIDSFVCYSTSTTVGAAELGHGEMTLDDEFESGRQFGAPGTKSVCVPAILNEDGTIIDSGVALASMALKPADGGTSPVQLGVFIQGLGPVYLDADQPDRLLMPAAVDESAPVPAPNEAAHALDRYKCYRATQSKDFPRDFPGGVKLRAQDAFEDAFYDFKRPSRLCNPVAVDGSTIKNTAGKLLCYSVRLSREQAHHVPRTGVHVSAAFGSTRVDTRKVDEICVPAR